MSINPNYLKTHELSYEIAIRLGKIPGDKVEERRKLLRGLLAQETADRSFWSTQDTYTVAENLAELKTSIDDLTTIIGKLDSDLSEVDYRRMVTRLTHCSGRVHRMHCETPEETKAKQEFLFQILGLEADLHALKFPEANIATSTPIRGVAVPPISTFDSVRKVPVYKWGIKKFSGKEPLVPFLELIDTLKISRGCTDADLFESASDLFESDAWTWWHNHFVRKSFDSWEQLVQGLKDSFLKTNYDQVLLNEIRSKKQRGGESATSFISSMEALFYRLTMRPSEEEMVGIIRSNLLPDYIRALVLQDVSTISDLCLLCKRIEDALGLTCVVNKLSKFSVAEVSTTSSSKCWNCGRLGHTYSSCKKARKLFCFGCGRSGVTKLRCDRCQKNVQPGHDLADPVDQASSPRNSAKNPDQSRRRG